MQHKLNVFISILLLSSITLVAQNPIASKQQPGAFPIVSSREATPLFTDPGEDGLVKKAAALFQQDIEMVSGKKAILSFEKPTAKNIILIGSIEKSAAIKALVSSKKLNVDNLRGKWEAYQVQVISNPFEGVDKALVIAGSDRRGTAYGVFELSEKMGVSPWYYWADVPVKQKKELYYTGGQLKDAPLVKYRGIFINDEAPALSGWSKKTFGGFNHQFYEKVFELILRMKGNYLWPAMWGSAFNDDDPLNPVVADEYGIVMGTSHHEPLVRAHAEWSKYGSGKWNYDSNATNLQAFWKKGIARMGTKENIVSVGMRGDGDEPMTRGTAIALLERIVTDQRKIIGDVTGKPASETPQLWALYKEVQDYYDKGMRVPDDITLLLCDDNWGNIRKLPMLNEAHRAGGYGIYYHYDYVGGPRNYKWINTNQIERTWEQMHLAFEYGVDKIWIVNVGDIKPMEFPTQFFLDYAWNPNKWNAANLPDYYVQWAEKEFGATYAKPIAAIMAQYTKYNSRRKPELLSPETYSISNYGEADRVVSEYNSLLAKAEAINSQLPAAYRAAFYQLVLHPVQASANLNELYVTVAKNRAYAKQNNPLANALADKAKQLYTRDSLITRYYNDTLAGGKWSHMMDQTHIGYTYWQQPNRNKMPEVQYVDQEAAAKGTNGNDNKASNKAIQPSAKALVPKSTTGNVFYEKDGYVSIEAPHYTKAVHAGSVKWQTIPNLGRTLGAVTTFPVTAKTQTPGENSPHLAYEVYLADTGSLKVYAYLSPTLYFHNEGLRYAISIDDETPQVIDMHSGNKDAQWNQWVANNVIIKTSEHLIRTKGKHVLKFWMVDPGVVLQKIVADAGGLKPSYLGPEETRIK